MKSTLVSIQNLTLIQDGLIIGTFSNELKILVSTFWHLEKCDTFGRTFILWPLILHSRNCILHRKLVWLLSCNHHFSHCLSPVGWRPLLHVSNQYGLELFPCQLGPQYLLKSSIHLALDPICGHLTYTHTHNHTFNYFKHISTERKHCNDNKLWQKCYSFTDIYTLKLKHWVLQ